MKNIILVLFTLVITPTSQSSLRVYLEQPYAVDDGFIYTLSCTNGDGNVIYKVDGLPTNANVKNNKIYLPTTTLPGNYILRVRAIDDMNKTTEQIIPLAFGSVDTQLQVIEQANIQIKTGIQVEESAMRLSDIITQHSTVTTHTKIAYEDNKYPQPSLPQNSNTLNTNLPAILQEQAIPSNNNRNSILDDDIVLKSATQRHQNAIKGIGNLLKIVDLARANLHKAKNDIQKYTMQYNEALAQQRVSQNTIITAETKVAQIKQAMGSLTQQILSSKKELTSIENNQNSLTIAKSQIFNIIAGEEKTKKQLLRALEQINTQLGNKVKDLIQIQQVSQVTKIKVNNIESNLNNIQLQLLDITSKRKAATQLVSYKKDKVKQLNEQLKAAEKQLASAQIQLLSIKAQEEKLPKLIKSLNKQLTKQLKNMKIYEEQVQRLKDQVNSLKQEQIIDLASQINQIQDSLLNNRKKITEIDDKIANYIAQIAKIKASVRQMEDNLKFVSEHLISAEEHLRMSYLSGNDANTGVVHAKQNIDASILRYKNQQEIVKEATLNIEKARAEEAFARSVLQQLIAKYSDALPYVVTHKQASIKTYVVDDWLNYISSVFGVKVSDNIPRNVHRLYAFKYLSKHGPNLRGGCGGYGRVRSVYGRVISINDDYFEIEQSSHQKIRIKIATCTRLTSNIERYRMGIGDMALVKGTYKQQKTIQATQAICLS